MNEKDDFRMTKMDFHVHSEFSPDSKASMEDMIQKAIEIGITDLAFTEHIDLDYDISVPDADWMFDQDEYFTKINAYKKLYNSLNLYAGVEIGLQLHLAKRYVEVLKNRKYDFIIASLHSVDRQDLFKRKFFKEYSPKDAIWRYYEQFFDSISQYDDYDVLGHLDLYVRYEAQTKSVSFMEYFDILEALLKKVIESGKGIELNAGGFRYNLGDNNPDQKILKLYRQLNGEFITLGSDAHSLEHLGVNYEQNIDYLMSLGFKYITIYKDRKPRMISIK